MNIYTFRISTFSDNPIFPVSKDKWNEEIITEKTSGIILVKICSDGWNEVFNRPPEYQCNEFDFAQFFHWLHTAKNLHQGIQSILNDTALLNFMKYSV